MRPVSSRKWGVVPIPKSPRFLLSGWKRNVGSELLLCMAHVSSNSFYLSASTPLKVKRVGSKPDCQQRDFHVLASPPTHSFLSKHICKKWLKPAVLGLSC